MGGGGVRRIAEGTRDIYASLAHRLGMAGIERELEELSIKVPPPRGEKPFGVYYLTVARTAPDLLDMMRQYLEQAYDLLLEEDVTVAAPPPPRVEPAAPKAAAAAAAPAVKPPPVTTQPGSRHPPWRRPPTLRGW